MTSSRAFLVAVEILLAAPAHAVTLAAGPLQSSTALACSVTNLRKKPVDVKVEIADGGGVISLDNCNDFPLSPGSSCGALAIINGSTLAYCKATASSRHIRGAFYVQTNNTAAVALPLTKWIQFPR